jgi:hypothetical protein
MTRRKRHRHDNPASGDPESEALAFFDCPLRRDQFLFRVWDASKQSARVEGQQLALRGGARRFNPRCHRVTRWRRRWLRRDRAWGHELGDP